MLARYWHLVERNLTKRCVRWQLLEKTVARLHACEHGRDVVLAEETVFVLESNAAIHAPRRGHAAATNKHACWEGWRARYRLTTYYGYDCGYSYSYNYGYGNSTRARKREGARELTHVRAIVHARAPSLTIVMPRLKLRAKLRARESQTLGGKNQNKNT